MLVLYTNNYTMSYTKITELIEKWGEYEKIYPNPQLAEFGNWLSNQDQKQKVGDTLLKKQRDYAVQWDSYEEGLKHHHKQKSSAVQIGILIGRLNKYARMYSKKALHHLSLNLDEFTFLATTLHLKNPKKSDVILMNLFEPTSGTEILRRLIKLNYIKEYANKDDMRSKLLKITALGEKTLQKAFEEMSKVGMLVVANLTEKQREEVIHVLDYLNEFHVNLFMNHKEDSVEEMIQKYIGTEK